MRLALPCYLLWPAGFAKPATIREMAKPGIAPIYYDVDPAVNGVR